MLQIIKGYYLNNKIAKHIIYISSIILPLSLVLSFIFEYFKFPQLVLYYVIITKFNLIRLADFIPLATIVQLSLIHI